MTDQYAREAALTREINELAALQIKAVKDATFLGWATDEKVAYEDRAARIAWLRRQLAE